MVNSKNNENVNYKFNKDYTTCLYKYLVTNALKIKEDTSPNDQYHAVLLKKDIKNVLRLTNGQYRTSSLSNINWGGLDTNIVEPAVKSINDAEECGVHIIDWGKFIIPKNGKNQIVGYEFEYTYDLNSAQNIIKNKMQSTKNEPPKKDIVPGDKKDVENKTPIMFIPKLDEAIDVIANFKDAIDIVKEVKEKNEMQLSLLNQKEDCISQLKHDIEYKTQDFQRLLSEKEDIISKLKKEVKDEQSKYEKASSEIKELNVQLSKQTEDLKCVQDKYAEALSKLKKLDDEFLRQKEDLDKYKNIAENSCSNSKTCFFKKIFQ